MSVVDPTIDDLLAVTDENRFLLCEMAARRARDINDMMRNQHNRAKQLAEIEDISAFLCDDEGRSPNPLSIAFSEISPKKNEETGTVTAGTLSYDVRTLNESLGLPVPEPVEEPEEKPVTVEELVADLAIIDEMAGADEDADSDDSVLEG